LVVTIAVVSLHSGPTEDTNAGSSGSDGQLNTNVDDGGAEIAGTCAIATGASFRTLNIAGTTRSYKIVIQPDTVFPASLVVAWHGITSDVTKIEQKMKLVDYEATAQKKSILVYPEAKNKNGGLLDPASFNGAGCCKDDVNFKDEEFFAAIIAELTGNGCVDSERVFVLGFSNGGFMTNRLACAAATRNLIAAACVHSGLSGDYGGVLANSPWMTCQAKPVLMIHGTSDNTVPIAGGKNPLSPARWYSHDAVVAMWANAGSCSPPTTNVVGTKTTATQNCGTHRVASIKHEGFGHDWHSQSTADCMQWFNEHGGL